MSSLEQRSFDQVAKRDVIRHMSARKLLRTRVPCRSVAFVGEDRSSAVEETTVVVVPHDDRWSSVYADEVPRVKAALSPFVDACEHIGSTAVPGLWAKPTVDILIGSNCSGPPTPHQLTAMAGLGYLYLGADERRPGRFFFRRRDESSFNVSVVPAGGSLWLDNLAFRDYLRRSPDAVARYSEVKRRAATVNPHSLLDYQDAKRAVVDQLKREAHVSGIGTLPAPSQ